MTPDRVRSILASIASVRAAVVGDLMLDEYVWGDVSRISPDAPVQVVDIRRHSSAIGGAGNVAHNMGAAGAAVALFGVLGDDAAGRAFRELVDGAGIASAGVVSVSDRPTTVKTRVIARGQQIVRLDREQRGPLAPESRARLLEALRSEIARCDVVLISDYAKGVVDRRLVGDVAGMIRASGRAVPILVDPKLSDLSAYAGCNAITPNRKEAEAATGVVLLTDDDVAAAAARIREATGAEHVLITLGERGLAITGAHGGLQIVAAQAREVYDVTGAGDSVLAYFGLALAGGATAGEAARLANLAGSVAVGRVGTSAVHPLEILAAAEGAAGTSVKALGLPDAVARVERERSLGRRIVFTNGCFDLLHAGHVHLLERARALGDFLVVGINSDASVRRLKGPERPVVREDDRVKVLAALDAVGLVTVYEDDTPLSVICKLRPDVLVKGGDYEVATIVGAQEVLGWGGRVETIPLVKGRSTSQLVEAMRKPKDD